MIKEVEVPMEERTKPFGEIVENETHYEEIDEFEWWPRLKMSMPSGKYKINPKHIIAEDFKTIDKGCCRSCHKKIKPYKETYYRKILDYCGPHCVAYGMKNDYCEECAKEKSRIAHVQTNQIYIKKTEDREEFGSGEYLRKVFYSDGSVCEEMTWEEKQKVFSKQE